MSSSIAQRAGLLVALAAIGAAAPARAWSNHTLLTFAAIGAEPAVTGAAPVTVETLDEFLAPNESGVGSLLEAAEAWSRREVPTWPALPDELRYPPGAGARGARQRFVEAARLSPAWTFPLFVQLVPGAARTPGRAEIAERELLPAGVASEAGAPARRFEVLRAGESVSALQVVTSAADEADYGLDMGLFEDSGTPWGKRYRLGAQSIGNPRLPYATQVPFHMGFFHEPGAVYLAAGFLRRMYPEQRIHLFLELSRYAFRTRHDYWGWRFAGLAMHYLQDLGQPYHVTVLPGKGAAGTIWNNLLAMVGVGGPKADMITLASNRHLVLEDVQLRLVHAGFATGRPNQSTMALGDRSGDAALAPYDERAPRDRISARARQRSEAVDRLLREVVPARYVDDPGYAYSVTEPSVDILALLASQRGAGAPPAGDASGEALDRLDRSLAVLLADVGSWTRLALHHAVDPR